MGSIELFPRTPARRAPPEGLRVAPPSEESVVRVRPTRLEDYAAVRALQRSSSPGLAAWTLRQLESQLHAFAPGQMVAVCHGEVVGMASALVLPWDRHRNQPTRRGLTGDGHFATHDASGSTLFAADLAVQASARGAAAARALFQARRALCRRMNLRRVLAAMPLAGYGAIASSRSPETHAMRVLCGDDCDAAMRLLVAQGFQYCGVLHDYAPEEADCGGHAALFAWLNPFYAPPRPPADEKSQRAPKCA